MNHINRDTIVEAGFWRSIGHTQNTFFVESFIDELAAAANRDPVEFRLELLASNERVKKVLETAASFGRWGEPFTAGASQGVAICADYGSVLALVCEVTIDDENKRIIVHRMSAADRLRRSTKWRTCSSRRSIIRTKRGSIRRNHDQKWRSRAK